MRHFYLRSPFYVIFSLFIFLGCSEKKPKVIGKDALLKEKIFIGDSLFKAGNYMTASEYYKKALIIQPNNQYVSKKLKEINVKTGVVTPVKKEETKIADTKPAEKEKISQKPVKTKAVKKEKINTKIAKAKPAIKKKNNTSVTYTKPTKKTEYFNKAYHVIIGSFKIKNNAILLANKFKNKGYNTVQISRFNGEFTAVSIASLNNIHTAYNNMRKIKDEFGIGDAWVLYQKTNNVATTNTTPIKHKKIHTNSSYNVVVGSFEIKHNADLLAEKYKNKGYDAFQISRYNGKFTAVAIATADNYQKANKNLSNIKNNLGVDAWILQQ